MPDQSHVHQTTASVELHVGVFQSYLERVT